jgi:hypothetical protein
MAIRQDHNLLPNCDIISYQDFSTQVQEHAVIQPTGFSNHEPGVDIAGPGDSWPTPKNGLFADAKASTTQ